MSSTVSPGDKKTTSTAASRRSGIRPQSVVALDLSSPVAPGTMPDAATPDPRVEKMMAAFRSSWPEYRARPESDRVIDAIIERDDAASLQAAVRQTPDAGGIETAE